MNRSVTRTLVVLSAALVVLFATMTQPSASQQGAPLKARTPPCDGQYKKKTVPSNVLKEILRSHEQWLEDRETPGSSRGDLCQADLRGAKLAGANLERFRFWKVPSFEAPHSITAVSCRQVWPELI